MDKETLIKEIADELGVSTSEKELAFEVFLNEVKSTLRENDAVKVENIGVFQLRKEPLSRVERQGTDAEPKTSIIYFPLTEDESDESGSLFLTLEVGAPQKNEFEFSENIFSIGVGKPLIPITESEDYDFSPDESQLKLKKSIEEKVADLISSSEYIENFDLWADYGQVTKEQIKEEPVTSEMEVDDIALEDEQEETELSLTEDQVLETEEELEDLLSDAEPGESEDAEGGELLESNFLTKEAEIIDAPEDLELEKSGEPEESEIEDSGDAAAVAVEEEVDEDQLDKEISEFAESDDTVGSETTAEGINWGDELKEELLEEVEVAPEEISEDELKAPLEIDEIEEEQSEEVTFDQIEHTLEEEVEAVEFKEEEDEILDGEKKAEELEGEEKEAIVADNGSEPVKAEVFDEVKDTADEIETGKKFRLGKLFWSVLALFIVVTVAGIYFLFFTGEDKPTTAVGTDTLAVKEIISESSELSPEGEESLLPATQGIDETIPESTAEEIQPTDSGIYRSFPNEVRITNTIYRAGDRYTLQVSSWKNKEKAETEARKLISRGFDAFITEAFLENLGGTWFRVRIGYFDSQQEAENFRAKNKI